MKKIILLFLLFTMLITTNVHASEMAINAPSAVVMDYSTGTVIYKKNENEKRPMASMTKIMTMILVMEQINKGNLSYDDMVEISSEASSMGGSQIFLQAGDKYKVSDLLKSIAMASANDAAVALAEKTYGSKEAFVEKMNEKAKSLGLNNTNFVNVHGLDEENHYSSAYDMAIMARELIKYSDILKYTSVYEEYLTKADGSQIWLVNTNKLVRFYEGVDGLKTGYTDTAGYCLTATAKKNNMRFITVLMGEDTIENRSSDTVKLLNMGFNTYKVNVIKSKDEKLGQIKITNGKKEYVDFYLKEDAIELLKNTDEIGKYSFDIKLFNEYAPLKKGQTIGKLYVYVDGNKINELDLIVNEEVKKANLWQLFVRNLRYLFLYN